MRREPHGAATGLRAVAWLLLLSAAVVGSAAHGADAPRTVVETGIPPVPQSVRGASYRPPRPLKGAENHLDVCYLPERLAGAWEDRWVTMNVHVPPEGGPHPCLIFIHGGGWGGGDKDFKFGGCGACSSAGTWQHAIREGYVVVNLNYILSYGGSSLPAVHYDFRAAVRFLRANAERFRIDPGRIAAWGFSAGGWLCSSAGLSEADDGFRVRAAGIPGYNKKKHFFHAAGDASDPAWADFNSRLSCMIVDLWKHKERVRPHSPPVLTLVGKGGTPGFTGQTAGGRVDLLTFLDPKYAGKASLHIPSVGSVVAALDGDGESTYEDEVFRWLDRELKGANRRTVPPEMRPNVRVFREKTEVRLVAASPDAAIHYTTDGSDPTPSSPAYAAPFAITRDTVVKALAVRDGEQPSPVVAATFRRGTPPPRITAPDALRLPDATVGKPYSVAFACNSDGDPVRWHMTGHLCKPEGSRRFPAPGVRLDHERGVLAGTPARAGTFTIQVHAYRDFGRPTGSRIYLLTVRALRDP